MKRVKKILIILGLLIVVLLAAGKFVSRWLENYNVEMAADAQIPEPATILPDVIADSAGWPAWKGLYQNNHAAFTDIKTDWSDGLEKLWSVNYLCKGDESVAWSCPVIGGNHLVITGRHDAHDIVFCLDPQTGQLYWSHSFPAPAGNASYGEGPRATPTIDANRVYVLSRGGILQCLRLKDGTVLWTRDYLKMGGEIPIWGFAGSPVVFGDALFVQVGKDALVIALDKRSGETIWRSESAPASYSTPAVIERPSGHLLLTLGGQAFFVLDPGTGDTVWQYPWEVKNNISICTPVYSKKHDIAVISAWYNKGTAAFRLNRDAPELLWHSNALNAHQTDPIILGDYIYGFSGMSAHNRNEFKCLDLFTGKEIWAASEPGSGQFIYVKPYFLSIDIQGSLFLINADPDSLQIVTRIEHLIETDNARFWTKPVLAHGNLYLRYANQLYCYNLRRDNS